MAAPKATAKFFTHGTSDQYEQVLKLYPQALRLKADNKAKKPEELIKLDNWYQNELPKKIKSRGKDAHMIHEELVQTMKWKQIRGKFYPQLSYLVKVNTPRMVMQETKKAFRKLPNLEQAITALSNLKGVGTTMASALLAAACPESAPFMADECLMAIPDIEGIDYTTKEYLKFAHHISSVAERLNLDADRLGNNTNRWSPHKVELAIWTHYVVSELKPELLDDIQIENGTTIPPNLAALHQNGDSLDADATVTSDESNSAGGMPPLNGKASATTAVPAAALDEDTRDTTASFADTENGSPAVVSAEDELGENSASSVSESTKDSMQDEDSNSIGYSVKRPLEGADGPPSVKKAREESK
ncbi:protein amun isoform X1 [Rhynchophorus ferrugineus]|uniref:protein amun isoform X1 n=2 Tax=Rhynchophorus ferrugineus TaxID=354439 RepID=UPI003FCEC549